MMGLFSGLQVSGFLNKKSGVINDPYCRSLVLNIVHLYPVSSYPTRYLSTFLSATANLSMIVLYTLTTRYMSALAISLEVNCLRRDLWSLRVKLELVNL